MAGWQKFTAERLRGELRCDATNIRATSSGLGWSSAYASLQREQPFEANLSTIDDCLMILHRSGPATVTFRLGGDRAVSQLRRRGQISVIPRACGGYLNLRTPHDTLHVYLKSGTVYRQWARARADAGNRRFYPRESCGCNHGVGD